MELALMTEHEPEHRNELQDSFLRLFSQYSRRIYEFVLTILPNHADAEEVFQNTCVILWRKFESYDPQGSFISWACRIAYLEMLDLHRREKRSTAFDNDIMESLVEEMASRMDRSIAREEALEDCLKKLDAADRMLVEQRYYHQRAPKDIARDVSRSIHSIYRSMARIHTQLRECVERALRKELAP
jgi:RNA polymerase sigma-70 factor, ECF subfamily